MPHQDEANLCTNVDTLKAAFAELLPTDLNDVTRHGNATLSCRWLAVPITGATHQSLTAEPELVRFASVFLQRGEM